MKVLENRGSSYQIRAGEANRNKEAALDDGKYTETNRCYPFTILVGYSK
ncbi:hypothetical protein ACTWQL_12695 [Pseudalkalibacillus sp. R45]